MNYSNMNMFDEIINEIKATDITKLENYIDKNGITVEYGYLNFFLYPKKIIEIIERLISLEVSVETAKKCINIIKNKRYKLCEIIKKGNEIELDNYMKENGIILKEFNTGDFDLLIYAIENEVPLKMIQYIINHCQYENFNYSIYSSMIDNLSKSPLFLAITTNNFKIADLLLNNGADINYNEGILLCQLFEYHLLNRKNLIYILNNGFHKELINDFVLDLIASSEYIEKDIYCNVINFLEIIFKHYLYNNNFILNILYIYKNKKPLSSTNLEKIITNESNNIKVDDIWYRTAVFYACDDILELFIKYDNRKKDIILKSIENYKKLGNIYNYES
ncbi:hypothetical protein U3516DRAFT_845902 [Neocallimastix sp. 'constans']